jgi:hypothetical protein
VATFNGDGVPKDWVKGYALVSMANAQGLPQAAAALAQMDEHIPLTQRQQAASLAVRMQSEATARRAQQLASADLATRAGPVPKAPAPSAPAAKAPAPSPAPRPEKTAVSPSAAEALAAVSAAREATGTESPADAGAHFAGRSAAPPKAAATPATKVAAAPAAKPAALASATDSKPGPAPAASAATGPWKVQLGVFAVRGNVERLWAQLGGQGELAGKTKVTVPAGATTKLLAGGFATRGAAEAACLSLRHRGHDCLVTR